MKYIICSSGVSSWNKEKKILMSGITRWYLPFKQLPEEGISLEKKPSSE